MSTANGFSDLSARVEGLIRASDTNAASAQSFADRHETEFNALALELFALQFEHNVAYQRICASRGVKPGSMADWRQIPVVPTAAFKETELSCLPARERTTVFFSSGTTQQQPSRHFHGAESLALYETSLWPWFTGHLMAGSPLANGNGQWAILTPTQAAAPDSSLVHMFETIRRKVGAAESAFLGRVVKDGAWVVDLEGATGALQRATQSKQPVIILGTAFLFVHLLDYLGEQDMRFELPPGSRAMETGGYKGRSRTLPKAGLHALITRILGIPQSHIICEYGMSELSSQAYDSAVPADGTSPEPLGLKVRRFRFPPWARVQVVSPETGQEVRERKTGLIQVFDLANVYSVMAIQTEDLGIRRGDGFELLGRTALAEPRGCSLMASE